MNTTSDSLIVSVALALVVSLLSNVGIGIAYLKTRDALADSRGNVTRALGDASVAREAAKACSDAVASLADAAAVLKTERDQARLAAGKKASTHNARADAVLAAPPPVAGDTCASAATRFSTWQAMRKAEVKP